jgi:hypothetical protein
MGIINNENQLVECENTIAELNETSERLDKLFNLDVVANHKQISEDIENLELTWNNLVTIIEDLTRYDSDNAKDEEISVTLYCIHAQSLDIELDVSRIKWDNLMEFLDYSTVNTGTWFDYGEN